MEDDVVGARPFVHLFVVSEDVVLLTTRPAFTPAHTHTRGVQMGCTRTTSCQLPKYT